MESKRGFILSVLVLTAALVSGGCKKKSGGGSGPSPSPSASASASPSPSPSPLPKTKGPLTTKAGDPFFYDKNGTKNYLLGSIVCCEEAGSNGWPLITDDALRKIAENKGNYTHIRLGPFVPDANGDYQVGYKIVEGSKVDLDGWNPAFWQRVRRVLDTARSLGIYVEVDIVDSWPLKHPVSSAWDLANNVNSYDYGWCVNVTRAPRERHEAWIRKVIDETGEFDNVIYQVGNETFNCGNKTTTLDWELGIIRIARDQLAVRGFASKLFGTNSHKAEIERHAEVDYISIHTDVAPTPAYGKPVIVNEVPPRYNDDFPTQLEDAYRKNSHWQLWRGWMNRSLWESNLQYIKSFIERNNLPR